jgi:acetyl-CoA carboxylase carboxyl transferase subunit alpha
MTNRTAWDIVKRARHPKRITAKTLIDHLFTDVVELKGDRLHSDDPAIIGAIGYFDRIPVTIIAEEKGVYTEDKIKHHFGMPHPEGYRKAKRLMAQAEKFKRPVITIIDTPGAYPGVDAEARGQARAIADNLSFMSGLAVPILSIILGEGGSGGALAIGVADRILMFENAIYSVVSPEGYASIVFKDATRADEAAKLMKLTAKDLWSMRLIDAIIEEGPGLETDCAIGIKNLSVVLREQMDHLKTLSTQKLLSERNDKYRRIGVYHNYEEKEHDA